MKKWEILNKVKSPLGPPRGGQKSPRSASGRAKVKATIQNSKLTEEIVGVLLTNRGIKTKRERDEFLSPKLEDVTVNSVGIDKKQLQKAVKRIQKAIANKEQIVVFGDYDVDGICGCAIVWETLHDLGGNVTPYIPHRVDEGYGLSIRGISNLRSQILDLKLIITVDNGIVANEAVKFANKQGVDVIITDHHVPSSDLPKAHAIVHTTRLCGTGVGWMLAEQFKIQNSKFKVDKKGDDHLALVALATVADLVPLTGSNRTLLTHGLEVLQRTKRSGIIALCQEAGIDQKTIGTYQIGHVIAPRLNAMGRIEHAMDSLRLLCTTSQKRAVELAFKLGSTNKERQVVTEETVQHARQQVNGKNDMAKLLFLAHESYQQGVIGLVAGKLVEEFYRPAIIVSIGEKYSKASARSVHGFNIIEFIRSASEYLVDAGGHPMAAGFTVETEKLPMLQIALEKLAHVTIDEALLTRTLRVDCEISLLSVTKELYKNLQQLAPFGMGNPEPTFVSRNVTIDDMRLVGKEQKHVKFKFTIYHLPFTIEGIGFGLGEKAGEFHVGDTVDIVYTIDQDTWSGNKKLQLKIKDIHKVT